MDITGYILRDKQNDVQAYITDADEASLKEAEANGCTFLVEYEDGSREPISADEIDFSNLFHEETIHLVQQEVFVPLMNAIADVLEDTSTPSVAVMSTNARKSANNKMETFKNLIADMNERYLPNIQEDADGTQ